MTHRIMVVDDDPDHLAVVSSILEEAGYEIERAEDAEQALSRVHAVDPALILTDLRLPGMDGVELLERVKEGMESVEVIVMTGHEDMTSAIGAMKAGAFDYVVKPIEVDALLELASRCLRERELNLAARKEGAGPDLQADESRVVIGRDPRLMEIFKMIGVLARNRATVLVRGETGTGKEVMARAIHDHSLHAGEPFIAVNCTALSDTLLESELFGHVKGAFTGAISSRKGYFELAGTGTIFLDEIGDTTVDFQTKLLRVLQDRTFFPVGGETTRRTQARIITATHQDLEALVEEGGFREDLYFRLRVVEIVVPPLRQRRGDIEALALHLLGRIRSETHQEIRHIDPQAMRALKEYDWPGNVRELENALTRASILARGSTLGPEHLRLGSDRPEVVDGPGADSVSGWDGIGVRSPLSAGSSGATDWTLDGAIGRQVLRVLEHTRWNKSEAARLLMISRSRLARLIEKFQLEAGGGEIP
ncbi:MAG: sigma-54-dependent Fis family transcriptional regulator [Gemmatimonadetes bacterium]|nr:sigma-54 dependent transcriptional regulator [Gemmatimonadota bacterium]NNM05720.1 sigma-54-dependent Fis family transcriptional regulator [Gemmatimonadota bacterium]